MRALSVSFVTALVLIFAGLAALYSGIINVGASSRHGRVSEWLLHTAMERSVRHHARKVPPPPADLKGRAREGAVLYGEMCAQCHGSPGVSPDELGQGLMPPAPEFAKEPAQWSAPEMFWIIKNGVRMTGMPAWGATHSDDQIWAMVSFLSTFPGLTPEKYLDLAGKPPRRAHEHGGENGAHEHEDKEDAHEHGAEDAPHEHNRHSAGHSHHKH